MKLTDNELRFLTAMPTFGGIAFEDIATAMGVSEKSVKMTARSLVKKRAIIALENGAEISALGGGALNAAKRASDQDDKAARNARLGVAAPVENAPETEDEGEDPLNVERDFPGTEEDDPMAETPADPHAEAVAAFEAGTDLPDGYEIEDEHVLVWLVDGDRFVILDRTPECPLCGSTNEQDPAGPEGTFLGGCLRCSDCDKTYSPLTGQEVAAAPVAESRKKRKIMNPQPKIDAKVNKLAAAGFGLDYDKGARLWWVRPDAGGIDEVVGEPQLTMSSREFSEYTPETLLARALAVYGDPIGDEDPAEASVDNAAEA